MEGHQNPEISQTNGENKGSKCITNHEEYLPKSFRSSGDEALLECEYCDEGKLMIK